ncbi:MAG: hypothetical protein ACK52J_05610 [bacterium]
MLSLSLAEKVNFYLSFPISLIKLYFPGPGVYSASYLTVLPREKC